MLRVGLILSSPSPHQLELLNAVSRQYDVEAFIGYVMPVNAARHWGRPTPKLTWENIPATPLQILSGQLRGWFDSKHADVWLLSSAYTNPATQAIAKLLRERRQRFAYLAEPPRPRTGLSAILQHQLLMPVLRKANAIIGTGTESARRYRQLSEPQQLVASVPYCIDVSGALTIPPITSPRHGEPYRFVTSAQLIHRKGIDVLIRACQRLPPGDWTLDIYGEGPLRETLEKSALKTGRPITFRGLLPYEQRNEAFQGKHCFVFSTRWDGWGMVLPEALAMGLPVISTDQAMSAFEFIRNGENGTVVPADDEAQLAAAMLEAMASRHNLESQSKAAKQSLADYTPENGADRLIRVLSSVARAA